MHLTVPICLLARLRPAGGQGSGVETLEPNLPVLLLSLLYTAAVFAVWVTVLVAGIVRWRKLRPMLGPGLMLGAIVLVLKLPSLAAFFVYLDPSALVPPGGDVPDLAMKIGLFVGLSFGVVLALIAVPHGALQIGLGQEARGSRSAYPTLLGRGRRFQGLSIGLVVGGVAGVGSGWAFWLLGVEAGETIRMLQKLLPGLQSAPAWVTYGVTLPGVIGVAIAEEILFRGVIQGWIIRWLGGTYAAAIVGILVSTALWTVGHAGNTDPLWIKLSQIFVLGLAFGALSHRYNVESSIAAHVVLNVSVVLLSPLFVSLT